LSATLFSVFQFMFFNGKVYHIVCILAKYLWLHHLRQEFAALVGYVASDHLVLNKKCNLTTA